MMWCICILLAVFIRVVHVEEDSLERAMELASRRQVNASDTWNGEINSSQALQQAMLIVTGDMAMPAILFADALVFRGHQVAASLSRLKLLSRGLFFTPSGSLCSESRMVQPQLSCAWSDASPPLRRLIPSNQIKVLSIQRSIVTARIVAMGFDLLCIDTDSVLFRDPFPHLLSPPFNNFSIIAVRGWSPSTASTSIAFIRSSRVAARMMEDFATRSLEWQEWGMMAVRQEKKSAGTAALKQAIEIKRGNLTLSQPGPASPLLYSYYKRNPSGCNEAEQFTDVLLSSIFDSQVRLNCLKLARTRTKARGELVKDWAESHLSEMKRRNVSGIRSLFDQLVIHVGPDLEHLVSSPVYDIDHVALVDRDKLKTPFLPHDSLYREIKGMKASQARIEFKMQLIRDRSISPESSRDHGQTFAYAPEWLFSSFSTRGRLGYWDARTVDGRPKQVVGSLKGEKADVGPDAIRHALNLFEWEAVHLALKSSGGSTAPGSLQRVISLAPELTDLLLNNKTKRSASEFLNALLGLAELGVLLNRIPVWPSVSCGPILGSPSPLPLKATYIKGVPYGPISKLRCLDDAFISTHCLIPSTTMWKSSLSQRSSLSVNSVRGVLDVEAFHLTEILKQSGDERTGFFYIGSKGNSMPKADRKWWELDAAGSTTQSVEFRVSTDAVNITSSEAKRLLSGNDNIILKITQPIRVLDLAQVEASRVATLATKCPAFTSL